MAPPRLDPWATPSEWQKVYQLLYSLNSTSKREGLSFIRMWTARCQRLPLSIECTGELIQASFESGDKAAQVAGYSLAVIRFVNGHIDKAQGGAFARSVARVAGDIDIPDWMIDIRHAATHKGLPTLDQLRLAARYALRWLEEKYWKPQNLCFENAENKVIECLERYEKLQKHLARMKREGKKTNKTEITLLVEQISSLSHYELSLLPARLVNILELTSYSFESWRPLFVQLDKTRPSVVAHLVFVLCQKYSTDLRSRANIISFLENIISENLFGVNCKDNFTLYVDLLLKTENNQRTRKVCSTILNHCSEKVSGKYGELRTLFNILYAPKKRTTSDISKLTEELKSVVKQLEALSSQVEMDGTSRFVQCYENSWEHIPLGCIPTNISPSTEINRHQKDDSDFHVDISIGGDANMGNIDIQICHTKDLCGERLYSIEQLNNIASSVCILDDLDS